MGLRDGAGDERALSIVHMLLQYQCPRRIDDGSLRQLSGARLHDRLNLYLAVTEGRRTGVDVAGAELGEADCIEQPLRFDRHQPLRGAAGELVVAGVEERRRFVPFYPEPKE